MKGRLSRRITLILIIVALVSTALTAGAGLFASNRLFNLYLTRSSILQAQNWADYFSFYYHAYGSFEGVSELPGPKGQGKGRGLGRAQHRALSGKRVLLIDASGHVAYDSQGTGVGAPAKTLTGLEGVPVMVDSRVVGRVVIEQPAQAGIKTLEQDFAESLTSYSLLVGIVACLIAAVLGLAMTRPISRFLRGLSSATHRVARGELAVRVPETGSGELRQLAEDFNTMARSLQKNEVMRRNLIADVAHELRTPLAVLKGNLEAIQTGASPPSPALILSLNDEVLRLGKLVSDMESLALAETGHLPLHREEITLGELLDRLPPVAVEIEARGLRLEVKTGGDIPPMLADPGRIVQVLLNLLLNAMNHSPEGGLITLSASAEGKMVRISITDEGPGIPAEHLPRVFDRFYRVADPGGGGGMGLGLAIARSYVEAHGGTISAANRREGGTIISFSLPAL